VRDGAPDGGRRRPEKSARHSSSGAAAATCGTAEIARSVAGKSLIRAECGSGAARVAQPPRGSTGRGDRDVVRVRSHEARQFRVRLGRAARAAQRLDLREPVLGCERGRCRSRERRGACGVRRLGSRRCRCGGCCRRHVCRRGCTGLRRIALRAFARSSLLRDAPGALVIGEGAGAVGLDASGSAAASVVRATDAPAASASTSAASASAAAPTAAFDAATSLDATALSTALSSRASRRTSSATPTASTTLAASVAGTSQRGRARAGRTAALARSSTRASRFGGTGSSSSSAYARRTSSYSPRNSSWRAGSIRRFMQWLRARAVRRAGRRVPRAASRAHSARGSWRSPRLRP
jgi:hypothetical protein